jgi:3-deoxy-7-phosphoheptulonate synthase
MKCLARLPAPAAVRAGLPATGVAAGTVARSRAQIRDVLDGSDRRLLVVVGPCSVHDPGAALDYAAQLAALGLDDDLLIVMRAYGEKPRTVTGWPGLIGDPAMDGSFDVPRGLRMARQLLIGIAGLGLAVGCEWLDPLIPAYLGDLVAWGAIGARTTESQIHRQLASGMTMPVGFKNGTDGDIQVAAEACLAAAVPQARTGLTEAGQPAVFATAGNPDCHVILRGGRAGPNYEPAYVAKALDLLGGLGLPRRVVVDASHGNSGKDHTRQPLVAEVIAAQVADGDRGIAGVMLESFLVAGRQQVRPGRLALVYGQSVTDACMSFTVTARVLEMLAGAARARREVTGGQGRRP